MVGINQSDFPMVNKQTAFKHLVKRERKKERERMRGTRGTCVVFLLDLLIRWKRGGKGRKKMRGRTS